MTNQMKKILQLSSIISVLSLCVMLILFFVGGIGYDNVFSYALLALNLLLVVCLLSLYTIVMYRESIYKKQIYSAKKLLELRNLAILEFYKKNKIKPQYNEKGELLTPDELLDIVLKKTQDGTPIATIYEMLGIEPVIDENGKEVPVIIVLKHLIKKIKTDNIKEIKKLNGLYLKGSKEPPKKEEKKASKAIKKAESGKKEKGGGGKKPVFISLDQPKEDWSVKPPKKEKKKEGGTKAEEKQEPKPEVKNVTKEEIKKEKEPEINKEPTKSSYYTRMQRQNRDMNINGGSINGKTEESSGEFIIE